MTTVEIFATLLEEVFWSGLAAMGFAILFNVPRRALPYCILVGALAYSARWLLMQYSDLSIEAATLVAATLVGFMSKFLAHRLQMPMLIFAVCGVIPMVPGTFAYNTMIALLRLAAADSTSGEALLVQASINAVKTALILGAIAVGIAAPTLLFQRNKPIA